MSKRKLIPAIIFTVLSGLSLLGLVAYWLINYIAVLRDDSNVLTSTIITIVMLPSLGAQIISLITFTVLSIVFWCQYGRDCRRYAIEKNNLANKQANREQIKKLENNNVDDEDDDE